MDGFNLFDTAIVVGSWGLMIRGITFKGLGVLRLIRVVVITIRSITVSKCLKVPFVSKFKMNHSVT